MTRRAFTVGDMVRLKPRIRALYEGIDWLQEVARVITIHSQSPPEITVEFPGAIQRTGSGEHFDIEEPAEERVS